jgi:hypothetical protein
MHRQQTIDRLDFENQVLLNQNVRSEACVEAHTSVSDRHRHLTPTGKSGFTKLEAKAFLVDRFKQPRAELLMDTNSKSNDPFGQCAANKQGPASEVLGVLRVNP